MSASEGLCEVLRNTPIASGFYDMWIAAPQMAREAKAGQFAHLVCGEKTLRRPISLCEIDRAAGRLRLVYEVRGEGTKWLSSLLPGQSLSVLAPLGRGFTVPEGAKHPVLAGGGLGVPPLLDVAREHKNTTALLGFRSQAAAILTEDFRGACDEVEVVSDDGSIGQKELVTAPLERRLKAGRCDYIAACGPKAMLKGVKALAVQYGVPCQISLEERMGCGVGACLVCVCKVKKAEGEGYARVCKDGPVFDAKEVVF